MCVCVSFPEKITICEVCNGKEEKYTSTLTSVLLYHDDDVFTKNYYSQSCTESRKKEVVKNSLYKRVAKILLIRTLRHHQIYNSYTFG